MIRFRTSWPTSSSTGSLAEVEKHVKEVIDVLSPGGGFLFKAQAISHLIPWENLKLSYDLALEYGRYSR